MTDRPQIDDDTDSLLFQAGFSGRPKMGTAGGDDFSVKVSTDGTSWFDAMESVPSRSPLEHERRHVLLCQEENPPDQNEALENLLNALDRQHDGSGGRIVQSPLVNLARAKARAALAKARGEVS